MRYTVRQKGQGMKSRARIERSSAASRSQTRVFRLAWELLTGRAWWHAGVFFQATNGPSKRWRAHIKVAGYTKHLGSFATEEDAAQAYDNAARLYHKGKAILNFPSGDGGGRAEEETNDSSYEDEMEEDYDDDGSTSNTSSKGGSHKRVQPSQPLMIQTHA